MMDDSRPLRLTRRGFLAGTVATALAACSDSGDSGESTSPPGTTGATTVPPTSPPTTAATTTTTTAPVTTTTTTTMPPLVTSYPFELGVASGDPLADSVILWTRLLPEEPLPDADIEVMWEVATDSEMADIVTTGTTPAIAALGHSVHADVKGLEANTEYYYRFRVGEFETAPARTHTFAAAGTTPEQFRFAFSSCQNWEQGYFAAYRDLVEQGGIDAFVFLGDYIYEYASGGYSDERGRKLGQDFECETVDQYRQRYALYQSDPLLQAAHALVPWIITWDDHEVDNDYAAAISENDAEVEEFLVRRAAGYQVWYEHMPVRLDPPSGPDYPIYRSFAHGDLLQFHVLDTRQYRADQQRGDSILPDIESIGDALQQRDDEVAFSPDQTMLGEAQRQWLLDGFVASNAVWDVLAQQVLMMGVNVVAGTAPPVIVVDTWDGYAGERRAVVDALGATADNLIVLTGDFHSAAVGDLRADPFDPSLPVVGVEFMASSISSSFFEGVDELAKGAVEANEHAKWFDARRGYTVCEVTPDRWHATFRAVADQFDEASPVTTITEWEVQAGTPGVVQLT
jgi:alkaline phosphatase D